MASRTARARLTARRCNADASKPAPQTLGERPPRRRTPSHYLNRAENDPLFEVSYCHVLGSAVADPSTPTALDRWRASFAIFPRLDYRIVVLGFVLEPGGPSRWLTHDEISAGASEALANGRPLTIVGTVKPWSARP